MARNFVDTIEKQELIQKLIDKGFGDLVDMLLLNENKAYTKKGRINKSGVCRLLNCKPKEFEDLLEKCKEVLKNDL
jgi:hypothetical protein